MKKWAQTSPEFSLSMTIVPSCSFMCKISAIELEGLLTLQSSFFFIKSCSAVCRNVWRMVL